MRHSLLRERPERTRGRPLAEIDWTKCETLLGLGCTEEEVAAGLGVSVDTLHRPPHAAIFAESIARCRARANLSLRQLMWGLAFGRRVQARDKDGAPLFDADGGLLMVTVAPTERIQFEAAKFLSKQREYLRWTERSDITTEGSKVPFIPTGSVSIVIDDTAEFERLKRDLSR